MTINCVWEHNGNDTLLYAVDYIGAYTRGESLEIAKAKMPGEIVSYLKWLGEGITDSIEIMIAEEKDSELAIKDADSDVLFKSEKAPLTADEYKKLKALALKSAKDFLALYESIPDKSATASAERPILTVATFYNCIVKKIGFCFKKFKTSFSTFENIAVVIGINIYFGKIIFVYIFSMLVHFLSRTRHIAVKSFTLR